MKITNITDFTPFYNIFLVAGQQIHQSDQLTDMAIGSLRLLVTQWRLSGFVFELDVEGKILTQSLRSILTKE